MNVVSFTGIDGLPVFIGVVPVKRAVDTNVVMVPRNDHFLVSIVVTVMVMRTGRAVNTNVIMVSRNNHFLVSAMVMVVMMVRCSGIMNTIVCASNRQFHENIYFACHTHHRPTTHQVASENGT